MMAIEAFPFLEIFLGFLGIGLGIMCCTTFCRACARLREEQIEREVLRRSDHSPHLQSIYVIPFHHRRPQRDSEDLHGAEPDGERTPPRYSTTEDYGPPPSYNELVLKPDELPPAYTEYNVPVYPTTPPPTLENIEHLQGRSQPQ